MARLPTVVDMGARPSSRSSRGIVSVRGGIAEEAQARGFREEGAAIASAGRQTSGALMFLAEEDARREAMQLDTEYADGVRLLQYGDGENPGYFSLKGQAAINGREAYIKGLESLHEKTLKKASSNLARTRVSSSLDVRRRSALDRGLSHFGAQREAANAAAFLGHQATLADDAAVQGAGGDTEGLLVTAEKAGTAAALYAKQTGKDPKMAAEAAVTNILTAEINRRAMTSPESARAFFNEHADDIDARKHNAIEAGLQRAERAYNAKVDRAEREAAKRMGLEADAALKDYYANPSAEALERLRRMPGITPAEYKGAQVMTRGGAENDDAEFLADIMPRMDDEDLTTELTTGFLEHKLKDTTFRALITQNRNSRKDDRPASPFRQGRDFIKNNLDPGQLGGDPYIRAALRSAQTSALVEYDAWAQENEGMTPEQAVEKAQEIRERYQNVRFGDMKLALPRPRGYSGDKNDVDLEDVKAAEKALAQEIRSGRLSRESAAREIEHLNAWKAMIQKREANAKRRTTK